MTYKTKRMYDCWVWSIVAADTKEEAINKLKQQCKRRNINFKYIVKVKELNREWFIRRMYLCFY